MKFKETKFKVVLAEITQTLDMKMAFVKLDTKGNYTNIHQWVKCRDFLGDAVHAVQAKKRVSIYNFSFDGVKKSMYKRKLMLAVKFPNEESKKNFVDNFITTMGSIAYKSGVDTGCFKYTSDPMVVVVEAPIFWQKSIAALSFYTFMLKCCGYKVTNPTNMLESIQETTTEVTQWDGSKRIRKTVEAEYAANVADKIGIFVQNIKKLTARMPTACGHPLDVYTGTLHNNSGFLSIIKNNSGLVGQRFAKLVA